MTRKNSYGNFVIAAGEVAEYALCPESWRLGVVEKKKRGTSVEADQGLELHESWAADFLSVAVLRRSLRTLFFLMAIAVIVMCIRALS